MKKFRFVIFALILTLVFDQLGGFIFSRLYFSEAGYQNDRLIHSVIGTNEDILIFGSSRAIHHYNPQVFSYSLSMSCYNVGNNGQNIFYHYALLSSALERYNPKMAFLELFEIDFTKSSAQWDTEKLNVLLPFASKSKAIYDVVLLRGESERIKLLSGLYPYNSLAYTTLRNIFKPYNNHINGYIPMDRTWNRPKEIQKPEPKEIDTLKLQYLFKFIEKCKDNKVELFILVSPQFADLQGVNPYEEISEILKSKYEIDVYNFQQDTMFVNNSQLFTDVLHLNSKGAEKYSRMVVQRVKQDNPE